MTVGKKSRKQLSKARERVFERDGYQCITAGAYGPVGACDGDLTIQHRVSRGMGGSALYDTVPGFLVTMCWAHNMAETQDADIHDKFLLFGWSVPRWVIRAWSIETVPVAYADGWHLLVEEKRQPIAQEAALTIMGEIYGEEWLRARL